MGRSRATVTRRLSTIAGFCKYAVEEELLDRSPAAHVRRPRVNYESHAVALDRNELGALLVTAGLGPPSGHALISMLALNGLRVSEATGADIEHLGLERGHRTLTVTRKGGKIVTVPLARRQRRVQPFGRPDRRAPGHPSRLPTDHPGSPRPAAVPGAAVFLGCHCPAARSQAIGACRKTGAVQESVSGSPGGELRDDRA